MMGAATNNRAPEPTKEELRFLCADTEVMITGLINAWEPAEALDRVATPKDDAE